MFSLPFSIHGMWRSAVALYEDRGNEKASEELIQHTLKITLIFKMSLSAYIVYSWQGSYYLTRGLLGIGIFLLHPGVALDIIAIPMIVYTSLKLKKIWTEYRVLMNEVPPINNKVLQQLKSEGYAVSFYNPMKFMGMDARKRYQEILETVISPEKLQELKSLAEQFNSSLWSATTSVMASCVLAGPYLLALPQSYLRLSQSCWLDNKISDISKWCAPTLTNWLKKTNS